MQEQIINAQLLNNSDVTLLNVTPTQNTSKYV